MQASLLPIVLFVVCALGLACILLILSRLFNPGHPNRVTRMPYESGMDPVHDTRRRFDVRFHLIAIAFMVFDVEMLFLYPWAVAMRPADIGHITTAPPAHTNDIQNIAKASQVSRNDADNKSTNVPEGIDYAVAQGWVCSRNIVFLGASVFLFLLLLGYIYDWRRGVFQWQ